MVDYRALFQKERLKKGYSQYKLAKQVGVSQTMIWEIENGRKTPSLEVFFRLCEVLEIRIFLDEEEEA